MTSPERLTPNLTNTEYERLALCGGINLSDGHARQPLTPPQRELLADFLDYVDRATVLPHDLIENRFLDTFFALAGVRLSDKDVAVFTNYSSSCAIKIAAQYCRSEGLRVLLIEPCFDNIRHLISAEGLDIVAIPENRLRDVEWLCAQLNDSVALWAVLPNNPTGFCLNRESFGLIADAVSRAGATLIMDFCFRLFAPPLRGWDQYRYLTDVGASFIGLEDTGKTWALHDIKVGMTVTSRDLAPLIHRFHDQLLLNVSPLHLLMLTDLMEHTQEIGFEAAVGSLVEANREVVHHALDEGMLMHASQHCRNVPIELLSVPKVIDAARLWLDLRTSGIDVLPAHNYYWEAPDGGRHQFRVPLTRPGESVSLAMGVIGDVVRARV